MDCINAADIRTRLSNLPTGLHGTYKLTLQRINSQKPELAKIGMDALRWVYFAARGMTVPELQHALSFRPGAKMFSEDCLIFGNLKLPACCGLLSLVKNGDGEMEYQFSRMLYDATHNLLTYSFICQILQ